MSYLEDCVFINFQSTEILRLKQYVCVTQVNLRKIKTVAYLTLAAFSEMCIHTI